MECRLGGEGVDIVVSEITPDLFFDLLGNTRNHDPAFMEWDLVEDQLVAARIYSNSNPVKGCYTLYLDEQEVSELEEIPVELDKKIVCKPGHFYLLSVAESEESHWHTYKADTDVKESEINISHDYIMISLKSGMAYEFMEGIYHKDQHFESRDASKTWPAQYLVVDTIGNAYSLSSGMTYAEAYENGSLDEQAITNVTSYLEDSEQDNSFLGRALFLRGMIYRFMGQTKEAIKDLQDVTANCTQYIASKTLLAEILIDSNEYESAIEHLTILLELEDGTSERPLIFGRIFHLRGISQMRAKKFAPAIKDFQAAISLYGDSIEYETELAQCKFELALLTEKFTNAVATDLFCEALSRIPLDISKLEQHRIRRILASNQLTYSALIEIASKALLDDQQTNEEHSVHTFGFGSQSIKVEEPGVNAIAEIYEKLGFKVMKDDCSNNDTFEILVSNYRYLILPGKGFIYMSIRFDFPPNGKEDLLDFTARINSEMALIRAWPASSGDIIFDHYIPFEPGYNIDSLKYTTDWFTSQVCRAASLVNELLAGSSK